MYAILGVSETDGLHLSTVSWFTPGGASGSFQLAVLFSCQRRVTCTSKLIGFTQSAMQPREVA
jgi:hypothetical protein